MGQFTKRNLTRKPSTNGSPSWVRKDKSRPAIYRRWQFAVLLGVAASFGFFTDSKSLSRIGGWVSETSRHVMQNDRGSVHPLVGRATVIDGDTVEIHGQRVRFNGIDAPESNQSCKDGSSRSYACGRASAKALDQFAAFSSPMRCEFVEWDQYGRFVGDCYRADGASVSSWLVRNGHAMDWPRYSGGRFSADQNAARSERVGIWAGRFQPPWEFRSSQRDSSQAVSLLSSSAQSASNCSIKGNINTKGERIYHVRGQRHYSETRINTARGERWFCSEAEARSAGWRKARR